jgi:DNA-binding LytR/AlgR family response regulator
MLRVIIIEDEPLAVKRLQRLITTLNRNLVVIAALDSIESSVNWLKTNTCPDIIFSDIQLADGLSFDIFEQTKINCPVIFTTAYDSYALKAFTANGIDYLLKPVKEDDLARALDKLNQFYTKNTPGYSFDYTQLANLIQQNIGKEYKQRFLIHIGEKLKKIETNDIAYFMADGKYVHMITFTSGKYIVDFTLEELEQVLNPKFFFRANRKYIINIKAVGSMLVLSKNKIRVELHPSNETECIVSSERSSEFKYWLNQ